MSTIKHKASRARKLEATGYFIRSLALVEPLISTAERIAPSVNRGYQNVKTKVTHRRNARSLQTYLDRQA